MTTYSAASIATLQGLSSSPASGTVSGATNATPIVITTSAAHGYQTGQSVTVSAVGGNTAANGTWTVSVATSTTFILNGSKGNAAYTTGGTTVGAAFGPGDVCAVAYYATAGDLGGGDFYWEGTPPTSATVAGTTAATGTISSATSTSPIVITSTTAFANGQAILIQGVAGLSGLPNGTYTVMTSGSSPANTFALVGTSGSGTYTANSGTAYTTTVTTTSGHGLTSGQQVMIAGTLGTTAINGTWRATSLLSTTFSIPAKWNAAWTSGGVIGDAGTAIPSTVLAGRWRRSYSGDLNVRYFGAAGNGTTDDTAAIVTGLAVVAASGGGTLFLPTGTYVTSSTVQVPAQCCLRGASTFGTTIALSGSSVPVDVLVTGGSNVGNLGASGNNVIQSLQLFCTPASGNATWSASSSATAFSVGQYIRPAKPSNILLRCMSANGTAGTGAYTPIGQLLPLNNGNQLLGQAPSNATLQLLIKCTLAGAIGSMKFQYSLDNGVTYNGTDIPTSGAIRTFQFPVPGTGYTLLLANPPSGYTLGQTFAPFPPIWLTGAPTAEWLSSSGSAIDVSIIAGGPLGTMTFQVSITGNDKQAGFSAFDGMTFTTAAGTSYAFTGKGVTNDFTTATGLTLHFGSGQYTASAGGANYTSAAFGWSMVLGTVLTDGGYTWEVIQGPACLSDLGSSFLKVQDVATKGGSFGFVLDQTESALLDHILVAPCSGAGLWLTNNGDHTPGYGGGFTNCISLTGASWFNSGNVYGIVDDGGDNHEFTGGTNFEGNLAGFLRVGNVAGFAFNDNYIEDPGGVVRDTVCFSRQGQPGFSGLTFHGNYAGSVSGSAVLDMYTGSGFSVFGNVLRGTVAAFTNLVYVGNAIQGGNYCTTPVFDFVGLELAVPNTYTASAGQTWACKTSSGLYTIDVPVLFAGQTVTVTDYDQNAAVNNITVTPPAGWVIQDPNTLVYGASGASVKVKSNGASVTWMSDGGVGNRLFIIAST